jgi:hypothetical protein
MRLILFFSVLFYFDFSACIAAYFQQEVNYSIHVTLNDKLHELSADETIHYKNNSGDTLNELYFHIWPEAYRNKNTQLAKQLILLGSDVMMATNEKGLGGIDSLDFHVNGERVTWNALEEAIDICKIKLNKPLFPGDSILIYTPFRIKIPDASLSRLGHDGQAYYITQWYPKPAVYDKNGWNYFSYLDKGEYYGEFGKFDVSITLPDNYFIAATGMMVDGDSELKRLNERDSITRLKKSFYEKDITPPSSSNLKTIRFSQDRIHDFAWFADKRWHVLKDSIRLKESGKVVTLWSFFNNKEGEFWLKSPEYMRKGIEFHSERIGDYPYNHFTSVDVGNAAGSGMEYPMITAIGNYGDPFQLELTIVHEIGHNWFYGILGTNERCHPWMDEGLTNFYETWYVYVNYANDSSYQEEESYIKINNHTFKRKINHRKRQYLSYLGIARTNTDQSPDQCIDEFKITNYHSNVYHKTTISFDYLKSYLGDSLFNTCMRQFFKKWKYKHPEPEDLKRVFEEVSGKKLDWIFNDLLDDNLKLDYKVQNIKKISNDSVEVKIRNTGDIRGPFPLYELKNDSVLSTSWHEGFTGQHKFTLACTNCTEYAIDKEKRLPELFEENNSIRLKGLFKKTERLKFSTGIKEYNPDYTDIYFIPVIGWNNYDEFLPGMVFHNISLYEKKVEYRLMPLYSTGTSNISGGGDIKFNFYRKHSRINRVSFQSGISNYAFGNDSYENASTNVNYSGKLQYTKIDTRITASVFGKIRKHNIQNEITLRNVIIDRDIPYHIYYSETNKQFVYWQAIYFRKNQNPLNSFTQKFEVTYNKDIFNLMGETVNFFNYGKAKKGFELRIYAGYSSLSSSGSSGVDYRMSLSGKTGERDYLFDEVFLGRTEENGILSQQFRNDYAGFKSPTSFYRLAEQWMAGINASTTLPGLLPFRLFANIGSFDGADENETYGNISWEMGIDLPLIKNTFTIYFPFAYSDDIKYALDEQEISAAERIRFELRFNMLNPLEQIKKVYNR